MTTILASDARSGQRLLDCRASMPREANALQRVACSSSRRLVIGKAAVAQDSKDDSVLRNSSQRHLNGGARGNATEQSEAEDLGGRLSASSSGGWDATQSRPAPYCPTAVTVQGHLVRAHGADSIS
jgi:hypothetical protein